MHDRPGGVPASSGRRRTPWAALTYSPKFAPAAASTAKAGKSFWTRVWDRIVEARMRQVEREIRLHLNYVPAELLKNYRDLPFQKQD